MIMIPHLLQNRKWAAILCFRQTYKAKRKIQSKVFKYKSTGVNVKYKFPFRKWLRDGDYIHAGELVDCSDGNRNAIYMRAGGKKEAGKTWSENVSWRWHGATARGYELWA